MTQQGTPDWHEARKGRVTGSIVGAILGTAPYMTRADAMRSMVRAYHGAEREFKGNIATEHGNANEQGAIWDYELETGNTVEPAFFDTYEDWLGASPDGYIEHDGLIEVKCPYGIRNDPDPKFKTLDEQPHYYGQIQIQLLVTGREWCHFFQWTPHGTRLETVQYDQGWIDENLPKLRQFYAEYLSELDNPEHLEPLRREINTDETKRLLDEYDQLSDAMAQAEERQDEVKQAIIDLAGDRNALMWGRKITRVERKGSVQYSKIPELKDLDLEPYRGKPSVSWRIT